MAKITFSDEDIKGDIPTYEIGKRILLSDFNTDIDNLLETRNGKIVVSFQSWRNVDYENEHQEFFISENDLDILCHFNKWISDIEDDLIDYNFFCFNTWEEAFKYCIDLKEGL